MFDTLTAFQRGFDAGRGNPDVALVDRVYEEGLEDDLAVSNAFLAFLTFRETGNLADAKRARFWLDYKILREERTSAN